MLPLTNIMNFIKRPRIPLPALLGLEDSAGQAARQNPFFFPSPLTAQRLALLKNMLNKPGQLVVVIGERGSGKTVMLRQLMAATDQSWKAARLRLKSLRTERADRGSCGRAVIWVRRDAQPPAMIVDDAHRLSRLELKVLVQSIFTPRGAAKVSSVVLFAEPQIRERFDDIARWLPPRGVIDKIYMTPLTEKQTDEYLRHRFKMAGFLPRHPFSPNQIRTIFKISHGLPGLINGEAFMLLKQLYAGRTPLRKPLFPWLPLPPDWKSLLFSRRIWARS